MGLGTFFRSLFGLTPKVVVDPKDEYIEKVKEILEPKPDPFEGLKIISREKILTKDLPNPFQKETPPFNPVSTEQANQKFNDLMKGEKNKRTINSIDSPKPKLQTVKQPKIKKKPEVKKDYSSYQSKSEDNVLGSLITGMVIESILDNSSTSNSDSYSSPDTSSGFDGGFGGGDFSGGGSSGDF